MGTAITPIIATLVAAVALAVCAAASERKGESRSGRREELNHGYGLLYEAASGLKQLNKVRYVKFESDAVDRMIGESSKYGAGVADDLVKLAKRDREISLDDTGLPEMEKRTRDSVRRERLMSLAPLIGMGGKDFERTLLLTLSGALNQQRHLSKALLDAEENIERKRLLRDVNRGYDEIYRELVKLLDERYFCNALPKSGSGARTEVPKQ